MLIYKQMKEKKRKKKKKKNMLNEEAIRSKFFIDVSQTQNLFSRPYAETNLNKVLDDTSLITSYATGVAVWTSAPVLVAFLYLLVSLIMLCCWCCCPTKCLCCKRCISNKRIPLFVIEMTAATVLVAFVTTGMTFNSEVSSVQTNIKSSIVQLGDDGLDKISAIRTILNSFGFQFDSIVTVVQQTLSVSTVQVITSSLTKINEDMNQYLVPQTINGQNCCSPTPTLTVVNASIEPVLLSLDDISQQTTSTLVNVQSQIRDAMTQANSSIDYIDENILDYQDKVNTFDTYDPIRSSIMYTLLSVFILFAIGFPLCYYLRKPTKILVITAVPFVFFSLLLMAPHIAIPLLLTDVCSLANTKEGEYISRGVTDVLTGNGRTTEGILVSCMANENLLTTLGYTNDELNFREKIKFPVVSLQPISLSGLTTFLNHLEALNQSTAFGLSESSTDQYLEYINQVTYPPLLYTRVNISAFNPAGNTTLIGWKTSALLGIQSEAFFVSLRTNTSILRDSISNVQANLTQAQASILSLNTTLNPLFGYVDQLVDIATCGFIADFYLRTKEITCVDTIHSVGYIALSLFFVSLSTVTISISLLCLQDPTSSSTSSLPIITKGKRKRVQGKVFVSINHLDDNV